MVCPPRPADRLVGIEREANDNPHLDRFIQSRDLGAVVRPYYGVDQADGDRLREIVAAEFGGDPIDLVVDDASHRYGATLASFEALFPLMRPGGPASSRSGSDFTSGPVIQRSLGRHRARVRGSRRAS